MALHSLTPFREIIKTNARPETIRIVSNNEPGTKIKIQGHLINKSGTPLTNKLVYIYQTSSEGWYSDTAPHIRQNEGDRRHARLFGYLKTDSKGDFEFFTVKPKGYPNSSLPAHIHLEVSLSADKFFISELQFDDDPRLVGEIRVRSIKENFLIAGNTGSKEKPIYSYTIQISN
jgi:protocatechuate 3,4-dioxygenase beta subunit